MADKQRTLYHGTSKASVGSILEQGLKPGSIGLIWATESLVEAKRFADDLQYPNKVDGSVVKIKAPRSAFLFERSLSGQKSQVGQRVARFPSSVPAAWLEEVK